MTTKEIAAWLLIPLGEQCKADYPINGPLACPFRRGQVTDCAYLGRHLISGQQFCRRVESEVDTYRRSDIWA